MARTHANGLAIAVIDHGKVSYVQAYGIRNAKGEPLTTDTVMYGASLTKMVFAYHVMQLVDQGKIKLDTPFKDDFDKPLIEYGPHSDQKFLRQVRPVYRSCRRSALEEADATHVAHALHRLRKLLVHRARPEAAHSL